MCKIFSIGFFLSISFRTQKIEEESVGFDLVIEECVVRLEALVLGILFRVSF